MHQTDYDLENFSKMLHASSVHLRGVAELHPFFGFDFNSYCSNIFPSIHVKGKI